MKCPHCGKELNLPIVERLLRWHVLFETMERDPRQVSPEALSEAFYDLEKEISIMKREGDPNETG